MEHKTTRVCDYAGQCLIMPSNAVYFRQGTRIATFRCMDCRNGVTGDPLYLCYECMRTEQAEYVPVNGHALVIKPIPEADKSVELPIACP